MTRKLGAPPTQDQDARTDQPVHADDPANSRIGAASGTTKRPATIPTSDPFSPFPVGTEGVVYIKGDESDKVPGLTKSGVVSKDSIVLPFDSISGRFVFTDGPFKGMGVRVMGRAAVGDDEKTWKAYVEAIEAFDPDGINILMERGEVARLEAGTRVRVIALLSTKGVSLIPGDGRMSRKVRVLEGQNKGKVVLIPTRNLRPVVQDDEKN